jgi:hypothetical protein
VGVTYNPHFELIPSSKIVRELWRPPLRVNLADLILGFPFAPSDMVLRRPWLFEVGLFDPDKRTAEDTDLPCRLALAGCAFASVDRVLNYRRHHSGRDRKNLRGRLNDVALVLDEIFADPRCPRDLAALRPTAIKHHLMVLVSLALSQKETDLAQEFLLQLLQVDATVLDGNPSELLSFLLAESVFDENIEHTTELATMFSQLPEQVQWSSTQYEWAVARGFLLRGMLAVLWDQQERGQAHFTRAVELQASIDQSFMDYLSHSLLDYEHEFGAEAAQEKLQSMVDCLENAGARQSAREIRGSYSVNQAFRDYRAGKYEAVPRMVLQAMRDNSAFLRNRGLWSIAYRSILKSFMRT